MFGKITLGKPTSVILYEDRENNLKLVFSLECANTKSLGTGFAEYDGNTYAWLDEQLSDENVMKLDAIMAINDIRVMDKRFFDKCNESVKVFNNRLAFGYSDTMSLIVSNFLKTNYELEVMLQYEAVLVSPVGQLRIWIGNRFYSYGSQITFTPVNGKPIREDRIDIDYRLLAEIAIFLRHI